LPRIIFYLPSCPEPVKAGLARICPFRGPTPQDVTPFPLP
jgi:hypothetical protein